ncbi:MAG: vitamin K epoxide reductase family protein [Gaiellaceae bacterium]
MSESRLRLAGQAIALLGAAVTIYLLYVRQTGGTLACATGGCEAVQHSRYADIFGVPVSVLGLVVFLGLFAAAAARGGWAQLVQATLALSALLFSAYLIYVQVAVIGDLCQWCLASDVLTSALAALAILRLRVTPSPAVASLPARPYPQRRPSGSRRSRPTAPKRRKD